MDAIVHHSAATSSALGRSSKVLFRAISQPDEPVTEKPSTTLCQSRIQVKPDARNRNVSRHWSGIDCGMDWSKVASISSPPEGLGRGRRVRKDQEDKRSSN